MNRVHAYCLALTLATLGCGGSGPDADSDAATPCATDDACSDGLFCNGAERCRPDEEGADGRGCVAGAPPCMSTQTCVEATEVCASECEVEPDADGDGVEARECGGSDCDDADASRFPGNAEICDPDGVDEDCDPATFGVRDADGDGYGDALCCNGERCGTDCDDASAAVNPMAVEVCNGRDDDCDGTVDEGAQRRFWPDRDRDGFGDAEAVAVQACNPPLDHVENELDCDDEARAVNPATSELCDGIDNNCNGEIDEAGARTFYRDRDEDGFGDPSDLVSILECDPPSGYVAIGTDCNDADESQNPGATELCNRRDDDCSQPGLDRGGVDPSEDVDEDGHAAVDAGCSGGLPRDDCDDTRAEVYAGAYERCDGRDNDCDERVDEGASAHCGPLARCELGVCRPETRLAVSDRVSCLQTDGRIECWSADAWRRGDGLSDTWRASLGRVEGISDAVSLDVQSTNSRGLACAAHSVGRVSCWGDNPQGLGDGSTTRSSVPVAVAGLDDVVEVGTGPNFACARRLDGRVFCWGDNGSGQLGDGTTTSRATPVEVSGLRGAIELDVSTTFLGHVCARTADRRVWCWGANDQGQLGDGTFNDRGTPDLVVDRDGRPVEGVDAVAVDGPYTCLLRAGRIECAGAARVRGSTSFTGVAHPTTIAGLSDDVDWFVGGSETACATRSRDGRVLCWGESGDGQAANGLRDFSQRVVAPTETALSGPDEIALGPSMGCARIGEAVRCWGRNRIHDPLGNGGTAWADVVEGFEAGARVHAGTCAVDALGAFRCWGAGVLLAQRYSSVPTAWPAFDGALSVVRDDTVCVVRSDRSVACIDLYASEPIEVVEGVTDADEMHLSQRARCVERIGGRVSCWVDPTSGPLNVVEVDGLVGVLDVALTAIDGTLNYAACAVTSTGELACWSRTSGPRVANVPLAPTPTVIAAAGSVREVAMGVSNATRPSLCVIRDTGRVACSGSPMGSDLGGSVDEFTEVSGVTDAIDLVMDRRDGLTACALRSDGHVLCWGVGRDGQLGRPGVPLYTPSRLAIPAPAGEVEGLTDATTLAADRGVFCANSTSRGLVCWGTDADGGLGRGVDRPVRLLP